ncbi:hypothetical protein NEAUS04_1019 [Nematocida ausubeli]|uniref:Uncharacterized protein n=1 Tax=Nematocida ausubeli (strain ATCC PRA-371 / ERTm2) TaxID=1913371 RepID=H8ZEA8_NEMA1|nr:uncharacterized protein NESG_01728 [Nematocida ausubeli]EHY64873.1 hypothetical protein NERG_01929 [Nematocida ausubeli]KAI5132880.1 hypothetical protein NEAUS06_0426 [Nematocida ausubeli]KAI5135493.1 hypothetical protein NEAUS07_1187 [Nematocida ausubeli]KAI5148283.1 hypothetical protein NEAUS05_1340 [Nematocida ausubeli]KAI5162314.1 hypothetical protein NEAUS04_1019 [Nematocida ausubeli]
MEEVHAQNRELSNCLDTKIAIQMAVDGMHISVKGHALKGIKIRHIPGQHKNVETDVFESLEIMAYDKRSTPMIRYIVMTAIENELNKLEEPLRLSVHVSVLSSGRYAEGAVLAVNAILSHLGINTEYIIDGSCSDDLLKQVVIKNTHGEIIYAVGTGAFNE